MNLVRKLAVIIVALAIAVPAAADTIPAEDAFRLWNGHWSAPHALTDVDIANSFTAVLWRKQVRYDGTSLVISDNARYTTHDPTVVGYEQFDANLSIALLLDDTGIVTEGSAIWTKDDGTLLLLAEVYAVGWEQVYPGTSTFRGLQIEARSLFAGGEAAEIGPRVGFQYHMDMGFLDDPLKFDVNNPWAAPWSCGFVTRCDNITNDDIFALRVPEPGSLALLGIGLFGMGLSRRNRQVR